MGEKRRIAAAVCHKIMPGAVRLIRGEGSTWTSPSDKEGLVRALAHSLARGGVHDVAEDALFRWLSRNGNADRSTLVRALLYARRMSDQDAAEVCSELHCMDVLES